MILYYSELFGFKQANKKEITNKPFVEHLRE